MKAIRLSLAIFLISIISFSVVFAGGDGKSCCKDKSTSANNKNATKCNTNKEAKAKKTDAEKTVETAKKS